MDFLQAWFWYLVAFLAGVLVAWLIAVMVVKSKSEDEAFDDLVGSRTPGRDS
jgi:hypothetical protein